MAQLLVRKLLIDLETPIAPRWNGGDAFRTAFFNALSMSFPVGEQYFMDAVRAGLQQLPSDAQQRFASEVQGFVGQEATHRRIHALFNGHLQALGYDNVLERRASARMRANAHYDVRIHLAATAATEHLTAIFADWMFRHPEALQGAEPRLQTLWMWHSAEEAEHCSTAFDLYQALGGNERWRLSLLRYVTITFAMDIARQTLRNLWHDKAVFRWSTWRSAAQLLFAKDGMVRGSIALWRAYQSPDFHPRQHDTSPAVQWLQNNPALYRVVGQGAQAN